MINEYDVLRMFWIVVQWCLYAIGAIAILFIGYEMWGGDGRKE
jgi:hypothetical protein